MGWIGYPPTKRRILLEVAAAHGCCIVSSAGLWTIRQDEVEVSVQNPRKAARALCLEPQYNAALFAFGVHDPVANRHEKLHGRR